jgi:hypothetical protein
LPLSRGQTAPRSLSVMTRRSSPPPTIRTPSPEVLEDWGQGVRARLPAFTTKICGHVVGCRAPRPEAHPAPAHKGRKRPPHRCGSCQLRAGATACLTGRDAQDRLRLLASSCRANASMPSAVKHVLSLPGDSRLRRCRFLPPVTGDPQQHHPVNRIVGAFSSIRALPRVLRIQLSQRHRRYSLSRAQTRAFSDVPSLLGADVR